MQRSRLAEEHCAQGLATTFFCAEEHAAAACFGHMTAQPAARAVLALTQPATTRPRCGASRGAEAALRCTAHRQQQAHDHGSASNKQLTSSSAVVCADQEHAAEQVLIIGGAGRVGSAVAIHLLSRCGWDAPLHVAIASRRAATRLQPVLDEITQARLCLLPLRCAQEAISTRAHATSAYMVLFNSMCAGCTA